MCAWFRSLVGAALAACLAGASAGAAPTRIAAAANLKEALDELVRVFAPEARIPLVVTYGSTGTIASQIMQGAPFELFLAADEASVIALARRGFARNEGAVYATGRLVLALPQRSPLKPDASLADLGAALAAGRIKSFAIANPRLAPYGAAAEAVLRRAGFWDGIQPKLVMGENVSQAAQFALAGPAEGAMLPLSLVSGIIYRDRFVHAVLPEEWHAPLRQRMALTKMAGPAADRFYRYMLSARAQEILRRHGYTMPPADAPQ
jgi:molybdate transport system substrate-binding protein